MPRGRTVEPDETAEERFALSGLAEEVEILIDRWGVPHIYARTFDDLFFAQGFNAARDRLWQLDLFRRRGLGLLSEVFGPDFVEQDRAARLFLYRGDMAAEWAAYGPDAERIASAFAAGVNAYIALAEREPERMPGEFRLLDYEPGLWAPEDIVRIRSHGRWNNIDNEVARARVTAKAGLDTDLLRRSLEPEWRTEIPEGLAPGEIPDEVLRLYKLSRKPVTFEKEDVPEAEEGSNNWAIAPSRTTTGRAILANDPHRIHLVPSMRYIAHLVSPELDVIGGGEPALPGISIGHNGRVAFGITVFRIDQEDLYVYETDSDHPGQYRYGDGWEAVRAVTERLPVRDAPHHVLELKFTRHGPVIYEDKGRHRIYAVRAAWLEPGMAPYYASIGVMRARDWEGFLSALDRWGGPGLNHVYADTAGGIGWKPAGRFPIRRTHDGLLPVPGDGRYEWEGFFEMSALPYEKDPERGWVGSANAMNLPQDFPIGERRVGFEWSAPWRAQRIAETLGGPGPFSLEGSLALQTDYLSKPAERVIRAIRNLEGAGAAGAAAAAAGALAMLEGWDARLLADSGPAALFEVWFRRHLSPALMAAAAGQEVAPLLGEGDSTVVIDMIERPERYFGGEPAARRDKILISTLEDAAADLANLLGDDPSSWRWGDLHRMQFTHPLMPRLEEETRERFSYPSVPRGGSQYTLNNNDYDPDTFRVTNGATYRMVLDVGAWDNSLVMNAPGQSGDPRSPHYSDLLEPWARDEAFPLLYSRARIEDEAEHRILLAPERD